MDPLKLTALDGDDIPVISAHVQDAVLKTADIHWRPREQRVVIGLNRFDWEAANGQSSELRRCRAALRFDRVRSCRCHQLDAFGKNEIVNLLSVAFAERDPPSGVVTLTFSGGAALRLEVECPEIELVDLGPVWEAEGRPAHELDAPQQG